MRSTGRAPEIKFPRSDTYLEEGRTGGRVQPYGGWGKWRTSTNSVNSSDKQNNNNKNVLAS